MPETQLFDPRIERLARTSGLVRMAARLAIERIEAAGLTVSAPPVDPQVALRVLYLVECANRCPWDDYQPGGDTEAKALASAVDDFDMKRGSDGKLYCTGCQDRAVTPSRLRLVGARPRGSSSGK